MQNFSQADSPAALRMHFDLEQAREAYESGGRPALTAFLEELKHVYGTHGILTDERAGPACGRSVVDMHLTSIRTRPRCRFSLLRLHRRAEIRGTGHYWFISVAPHRSVASWFITPDHLFWLIITLPLCYWLALSLTKPVRELQKTRQQSASDTAISPHASIPCAADELGDLARLRPDGHAHRNPAGGRAAPAADISHELRSPWRASAWRWNSRARATTPNRR